mgnify:CR=1 FL=1
MMRFGYGKTVNKNWNKSGSLQPNKISLLAAMLRAPLFILLLGLLLPACRDCEEAQDAYCAAWLEQGGEAQAVAEATHELEQQCSHDENRSFFYAIDQNDACLPDSLR